MKKPLYYIRLYLAYFKINFLALKIYDKDFIFGVVAILLKNFLSFIQLFFIFQLIDSLKGWTFGEMSFLYGMSTVSFAIWRCFFIHTMSIPYFVNSGEFDGFLMKPLGVLFQIITYGFDEDAWGDLILGLGVLIISALSLNYGMVYILIMLFLCLFTSLIFAAISLAISMISIFTLGNSSLSELVYTLSDFSKYPLSIFNDRALRYVFSLIIPIGWIAYFPLEILSNTAISNNYLLLTIVVSIVFFGIIYVLWRIALSYYRSSGT